MKIIINDKRTISEVKEEFKTIFPYLRLELYLEIIEPSGASRKIFLKDTHKTFEKFRKADPDEQVTITPEMTRIELCESLRNIYGLGVDIFRKSGKAWLETSYSGHWTLKEQNRQGEALSKPNDSILKTDMDHY